MDILKDDSLEFLDFTGVEESERKRILSSLHSTTADLQLPWIITQNVPSLHSKARTSKNGIKKKEYVPPNHVNVAVRTTQNLPGHQNAFVSHPYDQGQFPPIYTITPNVTSTFPVSPVPYGVQYPPAVVPMPSPIYPNFHHAPPQVMYSPDQYNYAQVSPGPASFDNLPQYTHGPQYGSNISAVPSHPEHNGASTVMLSDRIRPTVNNIPAQSQYIQNPVIPGPNGAFPSDSPIAATTDVNHAANENSTTAHINPMGPLANSTTSLPNQVNSSHLHVDTDSLSTNVPKTVPIEKLVHPPPTVSYGVPKSSPFPANKETNPSPPINKTDNKKSNGTINQNGVTTNGHETSASVGKSWASLFNKGPSSGVSKNVSKLKSGTIHQIKDKENNNLPCPIKNPRKAKFTDPTCYRMGEYLLSHVVDGKTISLQPRGLINRSNYCYINSILQALLACPPLYNLLSGLSKNLTTNEKRKPTPFIDSICKLVNEFQHLPAGQRVGRRTDKNQKKEVAVSINCDNPLEPSWIYKMLNGMRSDSFLIEGRQEDAEEFFGCVLNGLNDEMQELMKLVANDNEENTTELVPQSDKESEDWQVMGPKNKGSITRKTVFGKTPIRNIFGGLLRSKIHRAGDESTNNIQPFFTLQLNIEKAKTVSEALEGLATKNQLEGVTSSRTNEQVEAWQQVMIEELPIVLVLHLKYFDYQLNGCKKIMKTLEFPIDLRIDAKLLSSKITSTKEKQYKLFAVVYHDGKEATKGHYLTDAFHVGYNSWLRYDDASVKAVSEEQVLSPQGFRVPYLLFYRRSDTIRSK